MKNRSALRWLTSKFSKNGDCKNVKLLTHASDHVKICSQPQKSTKDGDRQTVFDRLNTLTLVDGVITLVLNKRFHQPISSLKNPGL